MGRSAKHGEANRFLSLGLALIISAAAGVLLQGTLGDVHSGWSAGGLVGAIVGMIATAALLALNVRLVGAGRQ